MRISIMYVSPRRIELTVADTSPAPPVPSHFLHIPRMLFHATLTELWGLLSKEAPQLLRDMCYK